MVNFIDENFDRSNINIKNENDIINLLSFFDIDFSKLREKIDKDYNISWIELFFHNWDKYTRYIKPKTIEEENITYNDVSFTEVIEDIELLNENDRKYMKKYIKNLKPIKDIVIYFERKNPTEKGTKKAVENIIW